MKRFVVPVGLTLLLLAGCGSSKDAVQEDRQFANNPPTSAVESPTATIAVEPTRNPASQQAKVDPSAPFGTRGAPAVAYLLDANGITIVDLAGTPAAITPASLGLAAGELVRDVSPAPSGERAAVLISDAAWSPGRVRIVVIDRTGTIVAGPAALNTLAGAPEASPVASPATATSVVSTGDGTGVALAGRPATLSWSPDGATIVATEAGSSLSILRVDDRTIAPTETIAIGPALGRIVGGWMSPRGDQVMVLLADAKGHQSIATILMSGSDRRPQVVWPGTDERGVQSARDVAWLPDGSGFLFSRSDHTGNAGNLYVISFSDLVPRVVATAGRAGPSGRIGDFVISPDGKSVAYTLESPADDGSAWQFHSLWVRALRGSAVIELPTGTAAQISNTSWTKSGVMWEQDMDLMVARSGVDVTVIAARGQDDAWHTAGHDATPGASPASTPIASPQATPAASPRS